MQVYHKVNEQEPPKTIVWCDIGKLRFPKNHSVALEKKIPQNHNVIRLRFPVYIVRFGQLSLLLGINRDFSVLNSNN